MSIAERGFEGLFVRAAYTYLPGAVPYIPCAVIALSALFPYLRGLSLQRPYSDVHCQLWRLSKCLCTGMHILPCLY